jgi:hypothetical protein
LLSKVAEPLELEPTAASSARVAHEAEAQRLTDISAWLNANFHDTASRQRAQSLGASAVLLVPLRAGGRAIGALHLVRTRPGAVHSLEEQQVADQFAGLAALALENAAIPPTKGHWLSVLYSRPVVLLVLYNFGALAAEWGVGFWLPSVVKETGASIALTGLLSALPYAAGAIMMVLVARASDRRQERKWHMIAATSASGLFLFCAQFATGFGPYATVLFLALSIGAFLGRFGPFWTLPGEVLPPAVAGVGIGLINGAGNLGGTVGPIVFGYVRDTTGSFDAALTVGGLSLIAASLLAVAIKPPAVKSP